MPRMRMEAHDRQLEGGARFGIAVMLDATADSPVRFSSYHDNRKRGDRDAHAAQDLRCERCGQWWPLDAIAMPGVTDFICRGCA